MQSHGRHGMSYGSWKSYAIAGIGISLISGISQTLHTFLSVWNPVPWIWMSTTRASGRLLLFVVIVTIWSQEILEIMIQITDGWRLSTVTTRCVEIYSLETVRVHTDTFYNVISSLLPRRQTMEGGGFWPQFGGNIEQSS